MSGGASRVEERLGGDEPATSEAIHPGHVPLALARDEAAERYNRGDLAGMTHLIEQAYSTASAAHAIARRRQDSQPAWANRICLLQKEALDQIAESMEQAEVATEKALRDVVAATPLLSRSYRLR